MRDQEFAMRLSQGNIDRELLVTAPMLVEMANGLDRSCLSQGKIDSEALIIARILVEMANGLDHSGGKELAVDGRPEISQPPNRSWKSKISDGSSPFPSSKSKKAEEISRKRKLDEIDSLCEMNRESNDAGDPQRTSGNIDSKDFNEQILSTGGGINPGGIINEKRKLIVIPPKQGQSISDTLDAEFPFSIIYFLSAIRVALTTPGAGDLTRALGQQLEAEDGVERPGHCLFMSIKRDADGNFVCYPHEKDTSSSSGTSECAQTKLPSLTFDQIMQRVRSKPGDARVLEMKVRLQDLVRGVLRMFSSKTPLPGIIFWKPLVVYKKSTKLWSWVGPVPCYWPRADVITTSPEAWGMRREILDSFVYCFGGWIKATQDVLQQIASLPPPPLLLMPQILLQERFRESKNLKNSVQTITPSSEGVRAYFHMEEALRYLIPEQAFFYTTRDGKRSTVAPLKWCSGTRKTRKHFILRTNRPPSFTALCLVRDAAARLPHGMGTRSDICTLVRDSQFVKEGITDSEIKRVVCGALDRLQCERDPCIKFHTKERLWTYLHGDKEEEDFDENCTASTRVIKNK